MALPHYLSALRGTLQSLFRFGPATFDASGLTAARTYTVPDEAGTVVLLPGTGANQIFYRTAAGTGAEEGFEYDPATNTLTVGFSAAINGYSGIGVTGALFSTENGSVLSQIELVAGSTSDVASVSISLTDSGSSSTLSGNSSGVWLIGANALWHAGNHATPGAALSGARTVSGTTDTPTASDRGKLIEATNASGCAFTINGAVFAAGDLVYFKQGAAGAVSFVAGSGGMAFHPTDFLESAREGAIVGLHFQSGTLATPIGELAGSGTGIVDVADDYTWTGAHVFNNSAVFNEAGGDFDYRFEGDTQQNLLFLDASTDRVGIGTGAPATDLHVVSASGARFRVESTGSGSAFLDLKSDGTSLRRILGLTSGDVLESQIILDNGFVLIAGATTSAPCDARITGVANLALVAAPTTPAADTVSLFGRKIAGAMLPAYIGASGIDSALQPLLARNKVAWANPVGNSTTLSLMGIALTATGTATTANVATTNVHTVQRRLEYAVTVAATSAVAGWRDATAKYFLGSGAFGGFRFINRFGPSRGSAANATKRMFVGLSSLTAAPTDVEPSTNVTNAIGMGCDAADANFQIIHRTGTGTATKVDLGAGFAKSATDNTTAYELAMFAAPGSSQVTWEVTNMGTGAVATGTITTALPATNTLLAPRAYLSVGGTSSVIGLSLIGLYIETDL